MEEDDYDYDSEYQNGYGSCEQPEYEDESGGNYDHHAFNHAQMEEVRS